MPTVSRGFHRRRAADGDTARIPPGQYGYHNYGDPWREQRYWGD